MAIKPCLLGWPMAVVLSTKKAGHFGDKHSIRLSSIRGEDTAGKNPLNQINKRIKHSEIAF